MTATRWATELLLRHAQVAPAGVLQGARLVGLDAKTGGARSIRTFGEEFPFRTPYGGQRLTLAPLGGSFSATVFHQRTDLGLLQGFNARKGLLDWFR